MAGGLAALLDDISLIAKKAAATVDDVASAAGRTSAKAAGVVVDDAAVTPKFVQGVTPARELPIIFRISRGSLVNKLLIILPLALLLSWLAPWALMPLLMVGGFYLSFEGAEKVAEKIGLVDAHEEEAEAALDARMQADQGEDRAGQENADGAATDEADTAPAAPEKADDAGAKAKGNGESEGKLKSTENGEDKAKAESSEEEDALVRQAVLTDFILSAEIMVISLNEVATEPFLNRTLILIIVALAITFGVYGFVGVLVKIDDVGLHLMGKESSAAQSFGRGLVKAMPKVLNTIAVIGTFAMLWVGGHILLSGFDELGWHWPHDVVAAASGAVEHWGGFAAWTAETLCSLVFGLIAGLLVPGIVMAVKAIKNSKKS